MLKLVGVPAFGIDDVVINLIFNAKLVVMTLPSPSCCYYHLD